jgi:putative chitinase
VTITNIMLKVATGDVLKWRGPIDEGLPAAGINNFARESMFLAQCAHESNGFTQLIENLRYSSARLLAVFPKYFTPTEALRMAYDERAIGERVYGGRLGNNIEGLGDGFKFRGRGIIGNTGRASYYLCGQALGVDLEEDPDLLLQPKYAVLAAAWFWSTHGCNELADAGNFEAITRKINGGTNGQEDREHWLAKVNAAAVA